MYRGEKLLTQNYINSQAILQEYEKRNFHTNTIQSPTKKLLEVYSLTMKVKECIKWLYIK